MVVWIGYLQWRNENGMGEPTEPILRQLTNIQHRDAILDFDKDGKPIEPEWPEAEFIMGNPPFLGGNKIREELGDALRGQALPTVRREEFRASRTWFATGLRKREGANSIRSV